jgi:hypothetical protein
VPILVRPVREQLEHDRIIRLLQAKYRRKHEVAMNVGTEQTTSVEVGTAQLYPDLVLYGQERSHRLQGTVEVETGESVNSLEAMAQWGPFSRLRAPFHLYIPPTSLDTVRRLCADHQIPVAEIWTYHVMGDQVRFTMVHRSQEAIDAAAKAGAEKPETPAPAKAAPKPAEATAKPARDVKPAKPAKDATPAAKAPAAKPAASQTARTGAKAAKAGKNGKAVPSKALPAKAAPVKAGQVRSAAKKAPARPAARAAKARPAARKR